MTNLSRQLCEICGIEPKCINCGQTVSEENPCPKPCGEQKYPDFTKPENFVRLLNLPTEIIIKNGRAIPAKNMWWIINMEVKKYGQLAPYYCDDFFIRLILLLQNENKYYNDELINRIKQSIREAEWVYE